MTTSHIRRHNVFISHHDADREYKRRFIQMMGNFIVDMSVDEEDIDEPTNGLDPAGMIQVRDLIRSLGDGNRTVLLSSHLLHEVEQVCDSVTIISKGKLVAQGEVAELVRSTKGEQVRVKTTDVLKARNRLSPAYLENHSDFAIVLAARRRVCAKSQVGSRRSARAGFSRPYRPPGESWDPGMPRELHRFPVRDPGSRHSPERRRVGLRTLHKRAVHRGHGNA